MVKTSTSIKLSPFVENHECIALLQMNKISRAIYNFVQP